MPLGSETQLAMGRAAYERRAWLQAYDTLSTCITRAARTVGVRDGLPLLDDGRTLDVTNVIWCTGFHGGFSWIDLPVFDDAGRPRHVSGIVTDVPGLYFVGLHFLHALSSSMIHGVGRDAARISDAVAARAAQRGCDAGTAERESPNGAATGRPAGVSTGSDWGLSRSGVQPRD
jgi:hypothetical protein